MGEPWQIEALGKSFPLMSVIATDGVTCARADVRAISAFVETAEDDTYVV